MVESDARNKINKNDAPSQSNPSVRARVAKPEIKPSTNTLISFEGFSKSLDAIRKNNPPNNMKIPKLSVDARKYTGKTEKMESKPEVIARSRRWEMEYASEAVTGATSAAIKMKKIRADEYVV